jgi:hypothetical protein
MHRIETPSSSNVKSAGYHAESRILEVEFKSGGVYRYEPVDADAWEAMMDPGASVGKAVVAIQRTPGIVQYKMEARDAG